MTAAARARPRPMVRASERAGVWQTVDGTTIRVEYGRPGARGPTPSRFAVRIPITPETGTHAERLTFEFDDFSRSGTTLRMHRGETVLPLEIRVRSTLERLEPDAFPTELAAADGDFRVDGCGTDQGQGLGLGLGLGNG